MEHRLNILKMVQAMVIAIVAGPVAAQAAGLASELVPLQVPDLEHAKWTVENLAQLAATQTGAPRVRTQRLVTVIKNLFTAEYQVGMAAAAGRKSERQARYQEHMSRQWMKPNAFGRVNDDAARESLDTAAKIRALAAQRMAAAQQNFSSQLQEVDSVVRDFHQLKEFEVVLVLAQTAAALEERSLAAGLPKSFPKAAVTRLRAAIQQQRTAVEFNRSACI